jgi:hypothetical protein
MHPPKIITVEKYIQYLVFQIQSGFVDHPERGVNTHLKVSKIFTMDTQLLHRAAKQNTNAVLYHLFEV